MIPQLRSRFNRNYSPEKYSTLLARLEERCGAPVVSRVAETPVFMERALLERMAKLGAEIAARLIGDAEYIRAAHGAIPDQLCVPGVVRHPHFLTASFGLVRGPGGSLEPRLVEIQASASVYAYQAVLAKLYACVYDLGTDLNCFLGGLDRDSFLELFSRTVLGGSDPLHVVLTALDPAHRKTRADFEVTARKLGLAVLDIREVEPEGNQLFYRTAQGKRIQIQRIYNRATAEDLAARKADLSFDLTRRWDVEWVGHPNWNYLISRFSLPWLTRFGGFGGVVPPAVFLDEFLNGSGRERLQAAGVSLPEPQPGATNEELVLKPLLSCAGSGIMLDPTQQQLEAIAPEQRGDYVVQKRVRFEPTVDTPAGRMEAEIRILYLWPDRDTLRPVLPLVRLGRAHMMEGDQNRDEEWTGGSTAFYPA